MLYFPLLIFTLILLSRSTNGDINESQNESTQFNELIKQGHNIAALFTQECCSCVDCVEAEVLLGGMSKEIEDNLGSIVVRLKSEEMKKRFDVTRLPTLLYIRENKTAIYTGKFEFDALYQWLQDNENPATVELDDFSFEHLTQAASGATTGDWLVLFHDGACCKNKEFMYIETAGARLKHRVNVASVNLSRAPETKKRFKIKSCPQVIFFRHQKLYRFSLPEMTHNTLIRFAEGFYKNAKAESVPPPPALFDKVLDYTIKFYKDYWYTVSAVLGLILCTILLLIFTLFKPSSHEKSE